MTVLVSLDGRILPREQACISVFDRGFLYGDSVYEVIRSIGPVPFALDEHLERLERSAGMLGLKLGLGRERIEEQIRLLIERADHGDSYIRIVATRGEGEIDLDPATAVDPHVVIIMKPYRPVPEELRREGAGIKLVRSGRSASGAVPDGSKTGNYLANVMALGLARREGFYEAVLVEAGGHVAEGASTNVFIVQEGRILTPALDTGILAGITRSLVIAECRGLGLDVQETNFLPEDLYRADEAFLTSTLRDVLPVVRADDRTIGTGEPGPTTRRIGEAYLACVRRYIEART